MRLTGRQWHDRGIQVGEVLVSDSGKRYQVYEDTRGARCIEDINKTCVKRYLFPMTAIYFTKETKMAVDWTKPLQIEGLEKAPLACKFLTFNLKGDKHIVETVEGAVYAAYKESGLLQGQLGFVRVTNKLKPWEEAFDRWQGQPAEQDYTVKKTFEAGFEAGLTYALGTVK